MTNDEITNADALLQVFGSWPTFHDAEVMSVVLERGSAEHGLPLRLPSLDIVIQDWVGPERTPWLVKLRFNGVRGVELEGFDQQNVVFELEVTALPEGEDAVSWKTVCSASVGFNGAWVSDEVEVVSVEMLDAPR